MERQTNKLDELLCELRNHDTDDRGHSLAKESSSIPRKMRGWSAEDEQTLANGTIPMVREVAAAATLVYDPPARSNRRNPPIIAPGGIHAGIRALLDAKLTVPFPCRQQARQSAQVPGPDNPVSAGQRIAHYEIIRELGRGGMGAVFLARDLKFGRRVAIKFLNNAFNANLARRFLLEARATTRCTHENIVAIHDVAEHENMPYMVLQYLRGKPMSKLLAQGRLPSIRAVELLIPVVRALCRAHELDIVHRDLKPDNIFLSDNGLVKVLDFGIAMTLGSTTAEQRGNTTGAQPVLGPATSARPLPLQGLTQQGAIIGALSYMSPEQWNSEGIDHRTDIWAVGIILYMLLVGRHPLHPMRDLQLAMTGLLDRPMPSAQSAPAPIPKGLADVIDTCLKKAKDERYASAHELLDALETLVPTHTGSSSHAPDKNPYSGLTAFQEADAERFFGRSREIAALLLQLKDTPLLAVVGPSGVGKSSVVRAGVMPALKRSGEGWETITVRPGRHPMSALANIVAPMITDDEGTLSQRVAGHQQVLGRLYREPGYLGTVLRERADKSDRKLLLFIDQFEELYTLASEQNERLSFTACLSGIADDC